MFEFKAKPDQHAGRAEVERPCKVYEPHAARYYAGTATVMSDSSVLLSVNRPLHLQPGDVLLLGLAQKRRQMLLHSSEMVPVRVIRSVRTTDGRSAIIVELCDPSLSNVGRGRRAA